MDVTEELKLIDEAIEIIIKGGQEYKIGSRTLKRANLQELYRRKEQLHNQLISKNGSLSFSTTFNQR